MKSHAMKQRKDSPASAMSPKKQKPKAAFDLWLQRGLHEIFDDVAKEPIPEELLRLIEEDRKK
jgi:hypothetical protein